MGCSVWIIFNSFDRSWDIDDLPAEVDSAIKPFVPTASTPGSNASITVTTLFAMMTFRQGTLRALVRNLGFVACIKTRRGSYRFMVYDSHYKKLLCD